MTQQRSDVFAYALALRAPTIARVKSSTRHRGAAPLHPPSQRWDRLAHTYRPTSVPRAAAAELGRPFECEECRCGHRMIGETRRMTEISAA